MYEFKRTENDMRKEQLLLGKMASFMSRNREP